MLARGAVVPDVLPVERKRVARGPAGPKFLTGTFLSGKLK